jgi:hypothetical protein
MGSDVAGVAREASGDAFLNRLRLSGIQRDPWMDAAGEVAQTAGAGIAANAGAADGQLQGQMTRAGYERVPAKAAGASGAWAGRVPVPGRRFG